jgi:hypothetical protein
MYCSRCLFCTVLYMHLRKGHCLLAQKKLAKEGVNYAFAITGLTVFRKLHQPLFSPTSSRITDYTINPRFNLPLGEIRSAQSAHVLAYH